MKITVNKHHKQANITSLKLVKDSLKATLFGSTVLAVFYPHHEEPVNKKRRH